MQIKYDKDYDKIVSDLLWYKNAILTMYEDLEDRKKYFVDEAMPKFIYILPINFDYKENAKSIFNYESEVKRGLISREFNKYTNSDTIAISNNNLSLFKDGIHLDFNGHKKLASKVKEILSYES